LRQSKLAFVTRGAVGTGPAAGPDPVQAAVWGLVRVAQAEHPGRFVLIDRDDDEPSWSALIAAGEPELCVRAGRSLAPRVVRLEAEHQDRRLDTSGTVLIAGTAGGTLEPVALHLVREHGPERLVLGAPHA